MSSPDQYPQLPPGVAPYVAGIASEFAAIRHGVEEAARQAPPVITFPPFPVQDTNFIRPETQSVNITLASGWTNFGSGNQIAGWEQIGTRIFVRGLLSNFSFALTAGTEYTLATLPASISPAVQEIFPGAVGAPEAYGRLTVKPGGAITIYGAAIGINGFVSLGGINFSTLS